jgi:two-component sensor histidine kinase
VGAFAVATVLRFLLDPVLPAGFPFLTFFPAVALTAFMAGTGAGSVQAALCFLVAWYFFIPPINSFALPPSQGIALGLYVVVVGTELILVHLMRRALKRLAVAEAQAREQARSRTLMFHELQHRVSNNLAVVSSLLALQRREVGDPDAVHALDVAVARVNVVSRLNRLLHNPDAQAVDFGAFLRAVVPDAATAAGTEGRVHVFVAAEPVVVPADKAIPLGLVATELLANALEHGFPGERRGNVRVELSLRDGRALLLIRDNGAGLPEGFDLDRSRSLGLQIARQFAGQLDADLSVEADGGVVSRLMVPLG